MYGSVFSFWTKIVFDLWLSIVLLIYLSLFCFSKSHARLRDISFHFLPATAKFISYLFIMIGTASFKDSQNWFFTFSPVKFTWNLGIELLWKLFSCFYVLHTSHLFELVADDTFIREKNQFKYFKYLQWLCEQNNFFSNVAKCTVDSLCPSKAVLLSRRMPKSWILLSDSDSVYFMKNSPV